VIVFLLLISNLRLWWYDVNSYDGCLGKLQDLLYGSHRASDGLTILSINNNAKKSILRFVTHNGRLVVNGRIFGVSRVLRHEGSAKKIMKGLLKLLKHGAKY